MNNISILAIFLEGVLSFLSPCVLPLLPLYMSYLAGENKVKDEDGNIQYKTVKVFITTLFFVLGIWMTFVLLSLSVNYIGDFIEDYKQVISIIGGTLLILFGLHEFGLIRISLLDEEYKLKVGFKLSDMNYFKAFVLGLVFSLGWSPCIGPLLAGAIMLASTESLGYLYLVAYGLGLTVPFLITGLLTTRVLNFLEGHKNAFKWVLKLAGIIMICFGCSMIYNASKEINAFKHVEEEKTFRDIVFADNKGNKVTLKDFEGEYIILNFSTTWCTYCEMEISEYEKFYEDHKDVNCFYVMSPLAEHNGTNLGFYLESFDGNIPILVDENGELFAYMGISSFPQTYVIGPDGQFLYYYPGATDYEGFTGLYEESVKKYNEN